MQLYYIRHGQSYNNALWERTGNDIGRSDDPELTELGYQQAQAVAQLLLNSNATFPNFTQPGGFGITHVYCSLMLRAVQTGTIIAETLGLPLLTWLDIHESGGMYLDDETSGEKIGMPGKNREYFEQHFPNLVLPDALGSEGWWNRPFEEREERPLRARRVVEELKRRHGEGNDRVVFVSHGGFYNHLLAAMMGLSSRPEFWFLTYNTGINRIDFDREEPVLVYQNRIDHLTPELLTLM